MDALEANVSSKPGTSARAQFAWAAVALLCVGAVVPIAQGPIVGSINVFGMQDGTAIGYGLLVAFAAASTYFKRYKLLSIPGIVILVATILYLCHFEQTKADLISSTQGNMFSGLASGIATSFHLQWGVIFLIVAPFALIVATLVKRDATSVRELALVNAALFIEGAAAIGACFLLISLLPTLLPPSASAGTSASSSASTPLKQAELSLKSLRPLRILA